MSSFGPNDFHYENGVLLQGLGTDEPSEKARLAMVERTQREQEKEQALALAQAAVERDSAALDSRETELAEREAALAARLKELEDREDELTAPAGGRRGK